MVDKATDTGIFSVANAWVNTADYAVNSLYQTMNGKSIDREQLNASDIMKLVDMISTIIIIAAVLLMILIFVMLYTQKKRLDVKRTTLKREILRLVIRLSLQAVFAILIGFVPTVIGMIGGYGRMTFKFLAIWMPYTLLIALFSAGILVVLLAISSLRRYRIIKNSAD